MSGYAVRTRFTPARTRVLGFAACIVAAAVAFVTPPLVVLAVIVLGLCVAAVVLSKRDATAVLTLLMVLLLIVPEEYVLVGPLKSYGYPAQIAGLGAFGLWCAGRMMRHPGMARGPQPMRWLMLAYAAVSFTSLAAAYFRPLTSAESAGSLRTVASTIAAIGITLYAADALRTRERLDTLLRRLILIAAVEAFLGIAQFLDHGLNLGFLRVPGLQTNNSVETQLRSDFVRVHSTAVDTIEFAVLVSALVPIALHYVTYARNPRERVLFGVATALLLFAAPMTVARSGVVALVIGLVFYAVTWGPRARLNAAVIAVIGLGFYRAAFPGLLGTLKSLLFIGNNDPSVAHRTADYALIPALMHGHVWFGRGLGTFLPFQYFFLDNQYLGTYIEGGLLAVAVMIALLVGFISLARGARKRSVDAATRSLGQALAGSLAAFTATAATFDEFGFKQTYFVIFALAGCTAALWRMTARRRDPMLVRDGVLQPQAARGD
jgi:hypothetical protein